MNNWVRDERGIGREWGIGRGKLGERRVGNRVGKMVKGAEGHKINNGTGRRGRKKKEEETPVSRLGGNKKTKKDLCPTNKRGENTKKIKRNQKQKQKIKSNHITTTNKSDT